MAKEDEEKGVIEVIGGCSLGGYSLNNIQNFK